jgi:YVTN family beta-propeller protein
LASLATTTSAGAAGYLGPTAVIASKNGKNLFVANADARDIMDVDVASHKAIRSIPLPAEPTGAVLSPDGTRLYVTCAAPKSTVAVIETGSGNVVGSIPAGHTAIGPAITPDGRRLYVCNRFNDDVSVIDLDTRRLLGRVSVIREPVAAVVTPDGKSVFVSNHLPLSRSTSYDVAASLTVIDTASNRTSSIRLPNGSSSVRGICVSPDGRHVYVVHVLAHYQMPAMQLERGWMNTNAMSIIDARTKKLLGTVLLDDVDLGTANPWGVTTTADSKTICVSHAGTHEVSVIDAAGLLDKLASRVSPLPQAGEGPGVRAVGPARPASNVLVRPSSGKSRDYILGPINKDVSNDLTFLVGLRRRIKLVGNGPRGLAAVGSTLYVAEYFSDTLGVVELNPHVSQPVSQLALGPPPAPTTERLGERLFNDADLCFQHWQSCASCHPDARVDGLNWDLMNDGLGNPKNTRSMLLVHAGGPTMWLGVRESAAAAVRSGIAHILFGVRPESDAQAIDGYLKSLRPVPSPRLVDGQLSAAAHRGKKVFFDPQVGCGRCHPEPYYSDQSLHDVRSAGRYDKPTDQFNTPRLIEAWRTAPYLHDGRYLTIKELLVQGKHGLKGTETRTLSDKEIDDLVEFVLSL